QVVRADAHRGASIVSTKEDGELEREFAVPTCRWLRPLPGCGQSQSRHRGRFGQGSRASQPPRAIFVVPPPSCQSARLAERVRTRLAALINSSMPCSTNIGISLPAQPYAMNATLLRIEIRRKRTMLCMQNVNNTQLLATQPRQSSRVNSWRTISANRV